MLKKTLLSCEFQNGVLKSYAFLPQTMEPGIFYWDTGEMYIGHLKEYKLEGTGLLIFSNKSIFYGSFANNNLESMGLYRCSSGDIYLGSWHENQEVDISYFFDKKEGVAKIRNENGDVICEKKVQNEQGFVKFLEDSQFRRFFLKFDEMIEKICQELNKNKEEELICHINLSHKLEYLGFAEGGDASGLGVFFESKTLFCLGNFEKGLMVGLGRVSQPNEIYDGQFRGGNMTGIGVYHNFKDDTYMYGYFENNFCKELIKSGMGYPHELIRGFKGVIHTKNKVALEKTFETNVFDGFRSFFNKWNGNQKNNTLVHNFNQRAPEIKITSPLIEYAKKTKPLNLYYSNYFEPNEKQKGEKPQAKPFVSRSIYEEAQEELRLGFPGAHSKTRKISEIPWKFNEIDFETCKNLPEKFNSENKSLINDNIKTPTKKKNKSPTKSLHCTDKKTTNSSVSQTKAQTSSKKSPNFKKNPEKNLKNVNKEKDLLLFSLNSDNCMSNDAIINRTSFEKNEEKKLRNTVFNNRTSHITSKDNKLKSTNLLKSKVKKLKTIQIIPKNPKKENFDIIHKAKTDNCLPFEKANENDPLPSPFQINPLLQSDKQNNSKTMKMPQMSSYYLLKEIEEKNKQMALQSNNDSPIQKKNMLVVFNRGNTLDENSLRKSSKETRNIADMLLQASQNYEEEFEKNQKEKIKNEEEEKKNEKNEKNEEKNEDFDENFPLNISESLNDFNVNGGDLDQVLSGFLQKKSSMTLSVKKETNEFMNEEKKIEKKEEEKHPLTQSEKVENRKINSENIENKESPKEMIEITQSLRIHEKNKENETKIPQRDNSLIMFPEFKRISKEFPNIILIQKENNFSRLFSFENKFRNEQEQNVETPKIVDTNAKTFDKADILDKENSYPEKEINELERSKTQNIQIEGKVNVTKVLNETNILLNKKI